MPKKPINENSRHFQDALFLPESDWEPPALVDLPSWKGAKRVAIDAETCDPQLSELGPGTMRDGYTIGWSFAIEGGPKHYLPIRHEGGGNLPVEGVLGYLREQARDFDGELVGANLSYDVDYAYSDGIDFKQVRYFRDVQVADPLIYELHDFYSLKAIGERWGVESKDEFLLREAAAAYGVDPKKSMWRMHSKYVGRYAENDTASPLEIYARQRGAIDRDDLWDIWNLESRVLPVLVRMRRRGVRIDFDQLERVEKFSLEEEVKALSEVHRLTGVRISVGNVWKPQGIAPALESIGVRLGRTSTGAPQIDKALLGSIESPVAKAILWARKVNKLRTTFADSIRRYETNGRIHCSFKQIAIEDEDASGGQRGARFGRLSAVNPNLQQQPARDEFAKMWRAIYIPEEGKLWCAADFCFSEDTRVLTREKGLVFFKDLDGSEHLAQVCPKTRELTYARPTGYYRKEFSGDLVRIHGVRLGDFLVTPNHKFLAYRKDGTPVEVTAEEYGEDKWLKHPLTTELHQEAELIFSEGEIVASVAAQADGSYRPSQFRVWTSKARKIDRLRSYPEIWVNSYPKGPGADQISFCIPQDCAPLVRPGKEKLFERDKLIRMSFSQRRFFIEELLKWDGSGKLGAKAGYVTTQEENAWIVAEVAALTGLRPVVRTWVQEAPRKKAFVVSFTTKKEAYCKKKLKSSQEYQGNVYCVSMPLGTLIVERNGYYGISKNSQQEPRWTTHFAAKIGAPAAGEAARRYREDPNTDNHDMMTRIVYGEELVDAMVPEEFKKKRGFCKNIFLGLCYGEGGAKLARTLNLPTRWAVIDAERNIHYFENQHDAMAARVEMDAYRMWEAAGEEAQEILDTFNNRAPYVKVLANKCQDRARARGYITTYGGRRLHFPLKDGQYDWIHKALNRLIQGSSADQVKKALVEVDASGHWLQLQVHDELDSSVEDEAEARQIGNIMENVVTDAEVPFKVDVEIGKSWGDSM